MWEGAAAGRSCWIRELMCSDGSSKSKTRAVRAPQATTASRQPGTAVLLQADPQLLQTRWEEAAAERPLLQRGTAMIQMTQPPPLESG